MSILKDIETSQGIQLIDAYIKITQIIVRNVNVDIELTGYLSKEKADGGYSGFPIAQYTFVRQQNGENLFQQGYEFVMSQIGWEEAKSC